MSSGSHPISGQGLAALQEQEWAIWRNVDEILDSGTLGGHMVADKTAALSH